MQYYFQMLAAYYFSHAAGDYFAASRHLRTIITEAHAVRPLVLVYFWYDLAGQVKHSLALASCRKRHDIRSWW